MSKDTIKVVQFDTDPAKKSIKDLRNELKQLKDQMANLEEGGDEFLEIANKAGELKHQIDEINESVKGASADFGDMVGNVTNVAAGLTGAFQAVAGGLQAMGLESKAVDETIKRMQGLMAVTQGLGAIDTAIKSLNKLQKSITATTGAAKLLKAALQPKVFLGISVAIAGLSAAFGKYKEKQEELIAVQEEYNRKIQEEARIKQEKAQQEYLADLQNEYDLKVRIGNILNRGDELKTQTALLAEYNGKLSEAQNQYNSYYEKIQDVRQFHKDKTDDEFVDFFYGRDTKPLREKIALYTDLVKKTQTAVQNLTAIAEAEAKIAAEEAAKEKEEAVKRAAEAAAEAAAKEKETAERRKKSYEEEVKTIEYLTTLYKELYGEDSVAFKEEELNLAERTLSNIKSYFGETSEEYKTQLLLVLDLRKALEELTEVKEETLSNEQIELALENDRLKELAKGWLYNEETAIQTFDRISEELKLALERDLITQQEYDNAVKNITLERTRYITQQSIAVFSSTANLITSLLNGLADQQDQKNKEGFEKSKKLQIAGATIQMLAGITTAIAGAFTSKTGPWDWILAGLQAATIATTGALQIAKIKSTNFEGGGSATPSASAVNATIIPPVQFSQAVQGASTEGAIQNQRVYVTESDIVGTINKVSVQEQENSY